MKNHEVRYNDVKKDDKVLINLRFYSSVDDLYLPVYVKALKPTKEEIAKYGTTEDDSDPTGVSEFCRINLTKWKLIGAPKETLKLVEPIIGETIWAYFNGNECAWKFFDPDGGIDQENDGLGFIEADISEEMIEKLEAFYDKMIGKCYAPHCDDEGNYGDESIHAVYPEMKCECDECDESEDDEEDDVDDDGYFHLNGKDKVTTIENLLNDIEVKLEKVRADIIKKRKNHKRIEVDGKMVDDILDYVYELEDL